MHITNTDVAIFVLSVYVLGVTIILVLVYRTLTSRLHDRKLMFEESNARVTQLMNLIRSEREQMAKLDNRNELLSKGITEGQTALFVSLSTQVKDNERRAIEAETAVNLARPVLPEAESNDEDMGLAIFEELTQTVQRSLIDIDPDKIPHRTVAKPSARPRK